MSQTALMGALYLRRTRRFVPAAARPISGPKSFSYSTRCLTAVYRTLYLDRAPA